MIERIVLPIVIFFLGMRLAYGAFEYVLQNFEKDQLMTFAMWTVIPFLAYKYLKNGFWHEK